MSLAHLWRDQGKRQKARELLAPVYDWFTEGFDTRHLKKRKRCWSSWQHSGVDLVLSAAQKLTLVLEAWVTTRSG
jgi:hypothetical protein